MIAALLPALGGVAAVAQTGDAPETRTLFEKLFPNPSGTNGYEEIVLAGERLRGVKAAYPNPGKYNTLAVKRGYVSDPASRAALSLLRRGVGKPVIIPDLDLANPTLLTASILLRSMARLLAFEIYVCFADGRNAAGLQAVSDGLAMAHPFKGVSIVDGFTARATNGIVWGELLKQRHGWSVRDCERIGVLARKYLSLPDPAIAVWNAERKINTGLTKQWRDKPELLADILEEIHAMGEGEPDAPASLRAKQYAEDLRTDPALRERIIREVEDDNAQRIDWATRLAADPTGVMTLAPPPDADKSRHPMLGLVRAIYSMGAYEGDFLKAGVESRVLLRFMAVHAAIRVFRWENDRLPKTLDELKLPARVTTDPFTAKPLIYEPAATGTDYVLASAGALLPGADGKPDTRTRFVFPPERAPTAAR